MKTTLALLLVLIIALAGCTPASPTAAPAPTPVLPGTMTTCEFVDSAYDHVLVATSTILSMIEVTEAGTQGGSWAGALDTEIAALSTAKTEIEATEVPEPAKMLRRDSLLFIGQALTLAEWLQDDGPSAFSRSRFKLNWDRMMADGGDLTKDFDAMLQFCAATE